MCKSCFYPGVFLGKKLRTLFHAEEAGRPPTVVLSQTQKDFVFKQKNLIRKLETKKQFEKQNINKKE